MGKPSNVSIDMKTRYLESLSDKEKIGIEIARKQLGSSFCLNAVWDIYNFYKKNHQKVSVMTPRPPKRRRGKGEPSSPLIIFIIINGFNIEKTF